MRFDDMLATVLRQPASDDASRQAAWRQLVDLLAQSRTDDDVRLERDAYRRLRDWRQTIPADIRRSAADALAGRAVPPSLVRFFGEDAPSVSQPLLRAVSLSSLQWIDLLPALSPTARALLRHRLDLGPDVERALASFGSIDFVLAGPQDAEPDEIAASVEVPERRDSTVEPEITAPSSLPPVSELLDRIARFRAQVPDREPTRPAPMPTCSGFAFETDAGSRLCWVDGAPAGALIGLSLLALAEPGSGQGVDGQVTGAVRARTAFRDGRLCLTGNEAVAGAWRLSGVPVFDPRTGRFSGYRGQARRPRTDEQAGRSGLFGLDASGASLQQLMHEIRTPLNAIVGFGEMIDHGVLGPAPRESRERAGAIVVDARLLVEAVEDLDTAARIAGGSFAQHPELLAPSTVARAITAVAVPVTRDRGVVLRLTTDQHILPITVDAAGTERMVSRIVAAAMQVADPGEEIAAELMADHGRWRLDISRGSGISGRSEAELLDPDLGSDSVDGGPLLGLGFSLRLVRSLAEAGGGRLDIRPDRFTLLIGAAHAAEATIGA